MRALIGIMEGEEGGTNKDSAWFCDLPQYTHLRHGAQTELHGKIRDVHHGLLLLGFDNLPLSH